MSFLKKVGLGFLLGGMVSFGGASLLRAQNKVTTPDKQPDAVRGKFYQLLESVAKLSENMGEGEETSDDFLHRLDLSSILRAQVPSGKRGASSLSPNGLTVILMVLARQKDVPRFKARATEKKGETKLVEISPAAKKHEVVVVPDAGALRVDIKATYGRWNNLKGKELDIVWFRLTGVKSAGLASDSAFQKQEEEKARRSSCQSNLKQQSFLLLEYARDHNGKYPPARSWMDALQGSEIEPQVFRCPSLLVGKGSGYAFNQNLDRVVVSRLKEPNKIVATYETNQTLRNAFGAGQARAYRHLGGSNIAFADGHVKWFAQGKEPKEDVIFEP